MSSFILKIIAIITMLFDHLGYIIYEKFTFMNLIGRLSFPIFAFQISEGYTHTKNLKRYFLRLIIFAIISQIPYMLFVNIFTNTITLNILFSLTLGLFAITIYNKLENKSLGICLVILCAVAAEFLHFDYGWFGISTIFIFYIFKKEKWFMNIIFSITAFLNYFYSFISTLKIEYLFIFLFCILSLIPINLYNGKKGKNTKYLLYIFYPLHLLVLYLLNYII